jgi:predicted ribosome quality control (RQC) complex YloA/Tae2 family protein
MKLSLKINKTLDENAQEYFTKAKKLRKKISGAEKAILISKEKILKAENAPKEEIKQMSKIKKVHRKWFEKFRWFLTSEGFLVIAGRDANTNEDIIKKHTDKDDIVFHTDMAGSPFVIIKKESCNKEITDKDLSECADFTLSFSRAWKKGFGNADIFYVKPDQVTKTANAGEHLGKGAFMIRGKTNYIQNKINLCIGIYEKGPKEYVGRAFAGPEESAKIYCKKYFKLIPGNQKVSEIAKILKHELSSEVNLDEFIRVIPAGSELKK